MTTRRRVRARRFVASGEDRWPRFVGGGWCPRRPGAGGVAEQRRRPALHVLGSFPSPLSHPSGTLGFRFTLIVGPRLQPVAVRALFLSPAAGCSRSGRTSSSSPLRPNRPKSPRCHALYEAAPSTTTGRSSRPRSTRDVQQVDGRRSDDDPLALHQRGPPSPPHCGLEQPPGAPTSGPRAGTTEVR